MLYNDLKNQHDISDCLKSSVWDSLPQ